MATIDPRIMSPALRRYEILSTYDIPRINRELSTTYTTLGQVYQAQSEAFAALTPVERRQDEKATDIALRQMASRAAAASHR